MKKRRKAWSSYWKRSNAYLSNVVIVMSVTGMVWLGLMGGLMLAIIAWFWFKIRGS